MKNTLRSSVTKDVIIFSNESEAVDYLAENNRINGRYIFHRTTADICSNCGGERDAEGWCANYCMDSE